MALQGYVELEFDEKNIINLCGYNNSGKSAITRAIEVVLYDEYSTKQVEFIHGKEAEFFFVSLEFDDGVEIRKTKYRTGKSMWEMWLNGELVYTNQLADGSFITLEVQPPVIAEYLGVLRDINTGEKVNVRRNKDKLFLIDTTGGENYKILNSILKSDILTDASIALNKDKNAKMVELKSLETSRQVFEDMLLEAIGMHVPYTVRQQLQEYAKQLEVCLLRQQELLGIQYRLEKLQEVVLYPEIAEGVNLDVELHKMKDVSQLLLSAEKLRGVVQVDVDFTTMLETLQNVGQRNVEIYSLGIQKSKLDTTYQDIVLRYSEIPEDLGETSILKNKELYGVGMKYQSAGEMYMKYAELHKLEQNTHIQLDELAKVNNLDLHFCDNCGSFVEV